MYVRTGQILPAIFFFPPITDGVRGDTEGKKQKQCVLLWPRHETKNTSTQKHKHTQLPRLSVQLPRLHEAVLSPGQVGDLEIQPPVHLQQARYVTLRFVTSSRHDTKKTTVSAQTFWGSSKRLFHPKPVKTASLETSTRTSTTTSTTAKPVKQNFRSKHQSQQQPKHRINHCQYVREEDHLRRQHVEAFHGEHLGRVKRSLLLGAKGAIKVLTRRNSEKHNKKQTKRTTPSRREKKQTNTLRVKSKPTASFEPLTPKHPGLLLL